MKSLHAHIKDGKDPHGSGMGKVSGKGLRAKKNQPILDLNHYKDKDDLEEGN